MMADAISTGSKLSVAESENQSNVPFKKGQLVVEDSGNMYYDNTQGTSASDRIKLSGSEVFNNASPTPIAVGGIEQGTTFDNMPVTEVLNKLLYPHVSAKIDSLLPTFKPSGVQECGTEVILNRWNYEITKGSHEVISIVWSDSLGQTETWAGPDVDSINNNGRVFGWHEKDGLKLVIEPGTTYSVTVQVTDAYGDVVTRTETLTPTWVYPYYYGVVEAEVTAGTITEAQIEAMTKLIQAKGTKNLTFTTTNQKAVIAYPASYGAIKKILDPNSFDVTGSFETSTISITGKDNTAVTYNVYVSDKAATTSNFKYTISY